MDRNAVELEIEKLRVTKRAIFQEQCFYRARRNKRNPLLALTIQYDRSKDTVRWIMAIFLIPVSALRAATI